MAVGLFLLSTAFSVRVSLAARASKSIYRAIVGRKVVRVSKSLQREQGVKENGQHYLTRGREKRSNDRSFEYMLRLEALYLATDFVHKLTGIDRGLGEAQDPLLVLGQDLRKGSQPGYKQI